MSDDNPYASPAPTADEPINAAIPEEIERAFITYHEQAVGLFAGLSFFGLILIAIGGTAWSPNGPDEAAIAYGGIGSALLGLGIAALFRSEWSYQITRTLATILFIASIDFAFSEGGATFIFGCGGAALCFVFFYQAHSAIVWAARLKKLGIPTGRLSLAELNALLESRSRTTSPDRERLP